MKLDEFRMRAGKPRYTNYMAMVFSRLSIPLSYLLVRTSVTPNQLSAASALVAFLGAILIQGSTQSLRLPGVVIWFVAYILDFCDGDIARYRHMQSDRGEWFDAVLDRLKDVSLCTSVTILSVRMTASPIVLLLGLLSLGGTITHSYAITYGFKRNTSAVVGFSYEKFGHVNYALLAFFLVIDQPTVFLAIIASLAVGGLALNVYFSKKQSSADSLRQTFT